MKNSKSTKSNTGYKGITYRIDRGFFEVSLYIKINPLNKVKKKFIYLKKTH